MAINPIAAARKEAQRQTYINEERKLVELGNKRKAAENSAAKTKEEDLIGAKDAEKLNKNSYGSYYQKQKQQISDSIAKRAGVNEDVFEMIGREYEESLRRQKEKEKEEEKIWNNFGSIFANEMGVTTERQSEKFSLGTENETSEQSRQNIHEDLALDYGVERELLDEINAEAAEKKGKDMFTEAMESSVWNTGAGMIGTADLLLGTPLQALGWEDNFISEWNSYYQDKAEEKHQDVMAAAERTGKGKTAEVTAEILTLLGEMGIDAVLSFLTGGTYAAAKYGGKGGKVLKYADDAGDLLNVDLDDVSDIQKSLQGIQQKRTIKEKLDAGELSSTIHVGRQNKHIEGTKEYWDKYKDGSNPQSVLTIDKEKAQELVNKYKGKGEPWKVNENGVWTEFVSTDNIIGKYYSNGKYYDTNRFAIHYSKKGAHIFPVSPRRR